MTGSKPAKPTSTRSVYLKRVYDAPETQDGTRVLVDRLWPRGLKKDKARIDVWMKEIAPSTELRRWFHHNPARWDDFRHRYSSELREKSKLVAELRRLAGRGAMTLLFASHDTDHNNAVVLQEMLRKRS